MRDNSVRSNTIEWLRFFCICAVVLLHSIGDPLEGHDTISFHNGAYDTVRILFSEGFCRVAVPIFFFFSGYLFFVGFDGWRTDIWTGKLKRRVRTLLIPYVLWNILSIMFFLIMLYPRFVLTGEEIPAIDAWFHQIGGLRALWDSGGKGVPYDYPLWFIRDLMVFALLAPVIYQFVKRTRLVGLSVLFLAYVLDFWVKVPGLSAEGLFFFAAGAYFALYGIDFTELLKQKRIVVPATAIAVMLLIPMVLAYGNDDELWGYAHRVFTLFGAASTIGIVATLIEKRRLKVHPLLSNSSFIVYAAHGKIVLPIMFLVFGKLLPSSQAGLIIQYFAAPLFTIELLVLCHHFLSKWMPKTLSLLTGGRIE